MHHLYLISLKGREIYRLWNLNGAEICKYKADGFTVVEVYDHD